MRKIIKDPMTFRKEFEKYKKWCEKNPFKKHDFRGKDVTEVMVRYEQPPTWWGFESWMHNAVGIVRLDDYRNNKDNNYSEHSDVLHAIDREIKAYQVAGAMTGVFNPTLVGSLNGVVQRQEVKTDLTVRETKIGFDDSEDFTE